MRISCLHTHPANTALYEAAAPKDVSLAHIVRPDLRQRMTKGVDPGLLAETRQYLERMRTGSDAVLLTCSSLAAAAEAPILSADRLLAEDVALRMSQDTSLTVDVLFSNLNSDALITTLFYACVGPVADLSRLTMTPVRGALDPRIQTDTSKHDQRVAQAICDSTADVVVLVQSSMALGLKVNDERIMTVHHSAMRRIGALLVA